MIKYTGDFNKDISGDDCPLIPSVLAYHEAFKNDGKNIDEVKDAILRRSEVVYRNNPVWGKRLIKEINGPSGGREFLSGFFNHWMKAWNGSGRRW